MSGSMSAQGTANLTVVTNKAMNSKVRNRILETQILENGSIWEMKNSFFNKTMRRVTHEKIRKSSSLITASHYLIDYLDFMIRTL